MINISAKAKQVATNNGFYVEYGTTEIEYNGMTIDATTIEISEENTDFLVIYVFMPHGKTELYLCPDYVQGLPDTITSTRQLTKIVEYIISNYND